MAVTKVKKKITTTIPRQTAPKQPDEGSVDKELKPGTYISGHCHAGGHEGIVAHSIGGLRIQPCKGDGVYQMLSDRARYPDFRCSCQCHEMHRQLEALTGVRPSRNEDPVRYPSPFPRFDPELYRSAAVRADTLPGAVARRTATLEGLNDVSSVPGRRVKGQLELEVGRLVATWHQNKDEPAIVALTPELAAIALKGDGEPISHGAIYAIFKRWEEAAYVELGTKPFRLVRPTLAGVSKFMTW